ncbi:MAG: hypothetical protein M1393_06965 [Candidatus Thermoplasmatota archaeon]|nr:hypothetical protein [Candidatus Thermoplasmatota archaeon]
MEFIQGSIELFFRNNRKILIHPCVPYILNITREIKTINGKQYAYEVSMVWDPDHRKRHKTSRYLGKIVDGKTARVREIVAVKGVYEIGHLELAWSLMSDVIGTLRKTFPGDQ